MGNRNMGYKYMEVLLLLLLQHKQSQDYICLWVGVEHISKRILHASSIPGQDTELGSILIGVHKSLRRLIKGEIPSASLISPRILSPLSIHDSILIWHKD